MEKIDKILNNPTFKEHLSRINKAEETRKYCLHGLRHLLDVARISYIINLEEGLGIPKEEIYAMALLHDIGRNLEYEEGVSHHETGARIALDILLETGFGGQVAEKICDAIRSHKEPSGDGDPNVLKYLLYKADKLSRNCFDCKAYDSCYWAEEKKNKSIVI